MILLAIIGIVVCILVLAYIDLNKKWNNMNRPLKGWIQYKGNRIKINNFKK